MRKILIGTLLVIGVVTLSGATAVAVRYGLDTTENIFTVDKLEDGKSTVSTFKHNGNRCYVVNSNGGYNGGANGISCVRFEK